MVGRGALSSELTSPSCIVRISHGDVERRQCPVANSLGDVIPEQLLPRSLFGRSLAGSERRTMRPRSGPPVQSSECPLNTEDQTVASRKRISRHGVGSGESAVKTERQQSVFYGLLTTEVLESTATGRIRLEGDGQFSRLAGRSRREPAGRSSPKRPFSGLAISCGRQGDRQLHRLDPSTFSERPREPLGSTGEACVSRTLIVVKSIPELLHLLP